jgi:hypothetical protein
MVVLEATTGPRRALSFAPSAFGVMLDVASETLGWPATLEIDAAFERVIAASRHSLRNGFATRWRRLGVVPSPRDLAAGRRTDDYSPQVSESRSRVETCKMDVLNICRVTSFTWPP